MVQVGIVGKPNAGKSTFFSAATLTLVPIANYPFTTIKPNHGISYLRTRCVHEELGLEDNPRNSKCIDGERFIPIEIIDLPGLVPGASEGRGLGNQFLDELRRADALIHVVDASGSTDSEGKLTEAGAHNPVEDVSFLETELKMWMLRIVGKDWEKTAKKTEMAGEDPNKIDLPTSVGNVSRLKQTGELTLPVSAEAELALRRAAEKRLIEYKPGDPDFRIPSTSLVNTEQKAALEMVREKVLKPIGSTGVQACINSAFLNLLNMIVVYPVENPEKFSDHAGNVLPDAYLVPNGTTLKELALRIHTEIGEQMLYGMNARNGMRLSDNYVLKAQDVVSIVSAAKRA
ncbi:TGS domain-containing protein [Candidatus Bathyarchaeota archaeon]|nr:MAG: TGS domain-containing protein [Candidatus Bathyarchaeota archaeon]